MYTTQKQIRKAFWENLKEIDPELYKWGKRSKPQNEQVTDIRIKFCEFVDEVLEAGQITEKMAEKVTL